MLDYVEFLTALKSSWIRQLIQYRTLRKNLFEAIINGKVNILWLKGIYFITDISKSINNIFCEEAFVVQLK